MRIGVNARTFSVPQPSGAVQSAVRLTRELMEATPHDVVLFGEESISSEFDVPVHSAWARENQVWGVLWERTVLPRLVARSDVDVLYCPNGNAPLTPLETPVVTCIHDVNAQKGWSARGHQLYRRLAVPRGARSSDAIVTVSEFSKAEIVEFLPVSESEVSVVYNGIDDSYFDGESEPIDLPDRYLLFVGSLNPRKNIDGLVEGFQRVKDERDVELVFVGPGNKYIFKDVEITAIDGVSKCGYLDASEVKYAYENAEAFVFPSFYEGFGLPPLEAFACGTPVVASDRGSLPEVLGDPAVYVDPDSVADIADGIREVLDGEFDRSRLEAQARKYTWESVATRLTETFESVVEEQPVAVSTS